MTAVAPPSLSPLDAQNALLELKRAYADGLAELEQAGHAVARVSIYAFLHKLAYVARAREQQAAAGYYIVFYLY